MNTMPPQQLWAAALGYLQLEVPRPNYETWLKDTTAVRFQGDTLVVATKSAFAAEMLERRMASTIARVLERVAKKPTEVSFEVMPATDAVRPSPVRFTMAGEPSSSESRRESPPSLHLNDRFSFDNFIVGPSNDLAFAAATAIADHPGQMYNPLYLWSRVGLGKTHLLQAIAHTLLAKGLSVLYVSSERFTNEYIRAIRNGRTERFRAHYRNADALLIDDIQFIADKPQTQEGFFHTFNELHMSARQVVVTGDEPARKSMLEERIQSRLEGGLVADIQPPDYETRAAILRCKADARGVTLSAEVVDLLASREVANVRELEGSLHRVLAYAQLTQSPLTSETVQAILRDIVGDEPVRAADPAAVMTAVASHFQIETAVLTGKRRDKFTAYARRVAMYLLREESHLSSTRIGTLLGGKDHSTVLYAQKKMEAQAQEESAVRQDISRIRQLLRSRRTR